MADRITKDHLAKLAENINRVAGTPLHMHTDTGCAVGHFYFENGYGGYKLAQVIGKTGAERNVTLGGYLPIREAYNVGDAYLKALQDVKYTIVKVV